MNLVICLLSTRYFIPADKIRAAVAGYQDRTDEAFSRMFERDKNELRDLGVPLETGHISKINSTDGYRINRAAYELPEINLTTEETAAVAVAMQLWQSPELATATQGALLKLRAAGVDVDIADDTVSFTSPAALPGIRGSEQTLGALLGAIDSGLAVQFSHRPSSAEAYVTRTVEPWGVVTDRGRWYLAGWDRDRDAIRVFRVSRIGADVVGIGPAGSVRKPDDIDLREIVAQAIKETPTGVTARVWLADDRAVALRRAGRVVEPAELAGRKGEVVELDLWSTDRLSREIAGYGADAVVLEPQSLREAVLARLRGQAERVSA